MGFFRWIWEGVEIASFTFIYIELSCQSVLCEEMRALVKRWDERGLLGLLLEMRVPSPDKRDFPTKTC